MLLYSWNVNGIRAATRKGFVQWLQEVSPDVVCLQEVKAEVNQVPKELLEVEGYHMEWNPAQRKGYSGVATFSKKKPKAVIRGMGVERFDTEGRILHHEFPKFDLFNVYFPNGTSGPERLQYKMEFYDAFLNHCEELRKEGRKLIICGDVNTAHQAIDLRNPKQNEKNSGFLPEERAWVDHFISHGYVDTFRTLHPDEPDHYSWWTYRANARERNVGWRIDYFFVTEDLVKQVKDAFITPAVLGSDHCPIGLHLK